MTHTVLSHFKRTVVEPCLEEEESYALRSRKLISIAVAMVASNAIVLGVPLFVLLVLNAPTARNIFLGVALLIPSVTSGIVPYGYLRRTKTLPDWLVDLQMWSLVPTTLAFSLYVHHSATAVLCACIALISIIMRIRLWPLMLMYIVALNGLHSLITDYPEELPALYDTFKMTHSVPIRVMALVGVNMSTLIVLGLGIYAIMQEFVQRSEQADAAIAMNLAVADKLRRYDTDGVALILAANKGKVDENLLEAFTAIQHNLQEYRPHIPDYVIAATTQKNTSPTVTHHEDAVINLTQHHVNRHDVRIPAESVVSVEADACSDAGSYQSDVPNERPLVGGGAHTPGAAADTMNSSLGDINSHSITNNSMSHDPLKRNSIRSTMSSMRREKDYGGDALTAHFYGRATTVFVRFGGPCLDSATDSAADRVAATLTINTCLESASKHARAHGGAMQYMQGCGLMVSFNAASRVMSHERDACLFAEALRQEIVSTGDVHVHVSIVTTPVLSFFAGKSGQLMLTVLGNFMPQHTAMHHHGRTLLGTSASTASIILISSSTMYGLDVNVTARPVGVVTVEGNKGNTISIQLFQVLGLVDQQPNAADDWMYAMERDVVDEGSKQTSAELEGAIKLALADDFSTALDVIRTSTVQDSVVEYITKRLEACLASEVDFPVKVDTHRMW